MKYLSDGLCNMEKPKQVLEKHSHLATLLPGLSEQQLGQFKRDLRVSIPVEIEDLLLYSAGFDYQPMGSVCFTGHEGFEFSEVFPRSVPVLPDGYGNFWVVDINAQSGLWGPVFYACHDPAVILVEAQDLGTFISQVLDPSQREPKNALNHVRQISARRIWQDNPWLISVHDARATQDPLVSNFAKKLPDNFLLMIT